MTPKQIRDNIRALKLLRRSYKSKKPWAYGLKSFYLNCPLCELFRPTGCRGCVWCEMASNNQPYACEKFSRSFNMGELKNKTVPRKVINRRLDHLEVQLQWLEKQKGKK